MNDVINTLNATGTWWGVLAGVGLAILAQWYRNRRQPSTPAAPSGPQPVPDPNAPQPAPLPAPSSTPLLDAILDAVRRRLARPSVQALPPGAVYVSPPQAEDIDHVTATRLLGLVEALPAQPQPQQPK